ncbi:MAG: hypothetical protein FWD16_04985, partial [Clostridia bacterium]|nr:hypothetical protein [Clostridia bacterium]
DDPMDPGVAVNKQVGAVNLGSTDAFVRISFAEALTKMNSADATAVSSVWAGAENTLPQIFNSKALAEGGAYYGWQSLNADATDLEFANIAAFKTANAAMLANVTILYRIGSVGTKTTYEFTAYANIDVADNRYDGLFQAVTVGIKVDKETTNLSLVQTDIGTSTVPNLVDVAYWQFGLSTTSAKAKWAELDLHTEYAAYPLTLNTPAITLEDSVSHVDALINLLFHSHVKTGVAADVAACIEGDWFYNTEDGYFYYIGVLASGQMSSYLLDGVMLDGDATSAYSNMRYDLTPCIEALQAVPEALAADSGGGWNLNGGISGAIATKLADLLNPTPEP